MGNVQTMISVGSILVATGPSCVMFLMFVLPRPNLVVVSLIGSFWWCLAMFLASAFWWAIPPLRETFGWVQFLTVSFQEAMRWILFALLHFTVSRYEDLKCFVRFGRKSVVVQGVAIGAAWGVMSALVNYVAYLHDFYTQDASIYTNLCPINFWVASASFACAFSILHIVLSTLAWQAYVVENRWMKVSNLFLIYLVHLGFAELGLGNLSANGCIWTMAVTWSVLGALCLLTTYFTLKSLKKIAQP